MDATLLKAIEKCMGSPVISHSVVGGGDISSAYRIDTEPASYFCKVNSREDAHSLFMAEKRGLEEIAASEAIRVPKVHHCEQLNGQACLIMEYIESKRPDEQDYRALGKQLARLHRHEADYFGWESDNFIGSLPQSNRQHKSWSAFFAEERLLAQLRMAEERGLLHSSEIPTIEMMADVLEELCREVRPSLLHGDLWSGNYLIDKDGTPFLIDPAVYYGHGEVDIAMSRLFGGFSDGFYSAYIDSMSGDSLSEDRIRIYQLYYLLVHLNLFGRSYYSGVKAILKSYFY